MAKIVIHAGDFGADKAKFSGGNKIVFSSDEELGLWDLEEVELATEENVKRMGGALGWGAIGGLALGPVGLLAGLLLGGKSKEITFAVKFKDGRKFLGTTDNKTYTALKAYVFK